MYAVVEIAGKQFRVEKDKNIKVPLLKADSGSKVEFDHVLAYTDDKGTTQFGKPMVADMLVTATVVEHGRDKKVIVFKKKRRKGYQKKNGHRQGFSLITINDIAVVKAAKKNKVAAEPKAEVKAPSVKSEAPAKARTTAKKTVAKKETAAPKKAAPKKAAKPKAEPKPKTEAKAKAKPAAKKQAAKKPAAKKETKEA